MDPGPFDTDTEPDPAFHFDTDPDPAFQFDSGPDPTVFIRIRILTISER